MDTAVRSELLAQSLTRLAPVLDRARVAVPRAVYLDVLDLLQRSKRGEAMELPKPSEIFEILDTTEQQPELQKKIETFLNEKKSTTKDFKTLIEWGFRLVEYHKKPEYQATMQASPK